MPVQIKNPTNLLDFSNPDSLRSRVGHVIVNYYASREAVEIGRTVIPRPPELRFVQVKSYLEAPGALIRETGKINRCLILFRAGKIAWRESKFQCPGYYPR